ncbi:MAG: hypothetical protein AB1689_27835 [Thermodesulfobacteriota bacterium]
MLRAGSAAVVLGVLLGVGAPTAANAGCDPSGADAADVGAARAAIAAACDCNAAVNHGSYVRCAREVAKATLANQSCLGAVARCAARSTCGRPGAVACCQTAASGVTRASIKAKADACRAPRGGSACVSPFASACDACAATGCAVPTPTATPAPTPTPGCGNGIVDPGEDCDGPTCAVTVDGEEVQSTCGPPGTLHACECRRYECGGLCLVGPPFEFLCGGCVPDLCWAGDYCLPEFRDNPYCVYGSCIPGTCETPSDCSYIGEAAVGCEAGRCCIAAFGPPGYCRIFGEVVVPCCGVALCGPFDTCCLPAGESSNADAECCDGSCIAGSCA